MRAKITSVALLIFIILISYLISDSVIAAEKNSDRPGKKAFSDPSSTVSMPPEWKNKPVRYEQWAEKADIAVSLEQDVYHTILPLIQKYAKINQLRIEVREGTCGIAAGMLARKTVDIGGFCCPAGSEDRLPGLKFHTLGIVGKAFFVHPDNPIDNISAAQLRDIFRGRVYKWSDLSEPKGKKSLSSSIKVVGRLHCQTRPGHWRLLLDNENLFSPRMKEVGSIPDMIAQVAANKDAIGWEVLSMIERYRNMGQVKVISIDGNPPNKSSAISAMKYPFYRTYNITTWEGKRVENGKARKLVDYLIKEVEQLDPNRFGFVSSGKLRQAGWRFNGNELIGEPK